MGLYIPDLRLPADGDFELWIAVRKDGSFIYNVRGDWRGGKQKVFIVPPHGRLIDEQEINLRFDNGIKTISELPLPNDFVELYKQLATEVKEEIGKCHTIIPASKGDE